MKPVSSWPDYGRSQIVALCDDGQLYALPILEEGKLISTEWLCLGPPIPNTRAALSQEIVYSERRRRA